MEASSGTALKRLRALQVADRLLQLGRDASECNGVGDSFKNVVNLRLLTGQVTSHDPIGPWYSIFVFNIP